MLFEIAIESGQPKGQVQLVSGTIAQTFHGDFGLVWPNAYKDRDIIGIELRAQPAEGASGDGLEHVAGLLKEWALILLSEPLDLVLQQMGGETKAQKTGRILFQGGGTGFCLLAEIGRGITGFLQSFLLIA